MQDFRICLLIYYDKRGIGSSNLSQLHLALAWQGISPCSQLLFFGILAPCLLSDLVFKSAISKELSEVHELVKVDNCLSFCNL